MELKLKMTLLTDAIFGSGVSVPGGEDSSILCDREGFPYYKGGSLKGIFREELANLIAWQQIEQTTDFSEWSKISIEKKLGMAGDNEELHKLRFYDFVISDNVKQRVKSSITDTSDILESFTYLRTFTKLEEEGMVSEGSLRSYRCVKAGITLNGAMICEQEDVSWVKEVLGLIKWIGTMRNRGFGKVKIEVI